MFTHSLYCCLLFLCVGAATCWGTGEEGAQDKSNAIFSWENYATGCSHPIPVEVPEAHIRHARTYLWFGMVERGDLGSFDCGLRHLEVAAELLDAADDETKETGSLRAEIKDLKRELAEQRHQAVDTFYGIYPLTRLLVPTLFTEWESTGTYDLIDHPDDVAVRMGASELAQHVVKLWDHKPQLDVVVTSQPEDHSAESEALYVLRKEPKLFPHSRHEWAARMGDTALERREDQTLAPKTKDALLQALNETQVLLVTVRRLDMVDGNYFYRVEGDLYDREQAAPLERLYRYGLSRERHHELMPILVTHGILLVLAVAVYIIFQLRRHRRGEKLPNWMHLLVVPVGAFVVGRVAPWLVIPIMQSVAPEPEAVRAVHFWWPPAVGAALYMVPAIFYRAAFAHAPENANWIKMSGRGGEVGFALAMGTTAYLSVSIYLYLQSAAVPTIALMTVSAALGGLVLGRALDSYDSCFPLIYAAVALVVFAMLGSAVLHLSILCVAGVTLGAIVIAGLSYKYCVAAQRENEQPYTLASPHGPADVDELIRYAESPPFQTSRSFDAAFERLEPFFHRVVWLGLCGDQFFGKTATIHALRDKLQNMGTDKGSPIVVLVCTCPSPASTTTRYAPFRQAFQRELGIEEKSNIMSVLVQNLSPSWLLKGGLGGPESPEEEERFRHRRVINSVRTLVEQQPLVLCIDDAQWIDESSQKLLQALLNEFHSEEPLPLAILVASEDTAQFASGAIPMRKEDLVELAKPDENKARSILSAGLRLDMSVVDRILGQIGAQRDVLFLAKELTQEWARQNVFEKTEHTFVFREGLKPSEFPGVPQRVEALYQQQLRRVARHQDLLACAAVCADSEKKFEVDVLATSLAWERSAVIHALDHIEHDTGLVGDVLELDDFYAFKSYLVWTFVTQQLGITFAGPSDRNTPQRIRDCHERVAKALESKVGREPDVIFQIARNYYAAGRRCMGRAGDFCVKAAQQASRLLRFEEAREYLTMAQGCGALSAGDLTIDELGLLIDLHESHVTGKALVDVAHHGLDYANEHPQAASAILIAVARACYDAREEQGNLIDKALDMAERALKSATTPVERAEARQFLGISLPRNRQSEREAHLREALKQLAVAQDEQPEIQALHGRILDSLAGLLAREDASRDEWDEAYTLYRQSVEIKEKPEINDLPGLARSYGGLGRLEELRHPETLEEAHQWYEKDLEISIQIDDRKGQVMMYSALGALGLHRGNIVAARKYYEKSLDMATIAIDRCFAAAGLLACACDDEDSNGMEEYGRELVQISKTVELPGFCRHRVTEILNDYCPELPDAEWYSALRDKMGQDL